MYCMLSASLCLNRTVAKCENKSQMDLVLCCGKVLTPGALCAGRSIQCYTGCVKISSFRKGISPYVQSWCNGAVYTCSILVVWCAPGCSTWSASCMVQSDQPCFINEKLAMAKWKCLQLRR